MKLPILLPLLPLLPTLPATPLIPRLNPGPGTLLITDLKIWSIRHGVGAK